jgi:hypothetical protein
MKPHTVLAGVLAGLAGLTALAPADNPAQLTVRKGMTPAEVQARLGPPSRVARQVLFRRHVEQWAYDGPQHLRVEFCCTRSAEPYVTAILTDRQVRP